MTESALQGKTYFVWDLFDQSEGLTERINEPPWGRCLQGVVDARWVVVVVVVAVVCFCCCCRRLTGG